MTIPILRPRLNSTFKSNFQTNSKIFSIINLEAITAKKIAINMTDLKMIISESTGYVGIGTQIPDKTGIQNGVKVMQFKIATVRNGQ